MVDIRVDDGAVQQIDHPRYDESHKVMSDKDKSQTGRLLQHELSVQKPPETSRVMVNDEMVELAALKRLNAPERLDEPVRVEPVGTTSRDPTDDDIVVKVDERDRAVTTSPAKVPRMLKNLESDLKEAVLGPRVRAPPKFYGKLTRLRRLNVRRAEANTEKVAARQAMANDKRVALRESETEVETETEDDHQSHFVPGEHYQLPCKSRSVMTARTARGLVEMAKQMPGESTAKWDKRLEEMGDRLTKQATDEGLPDDGDKEALLYAYVAVQLAANRISVKNALNDKDTNRSKKASTWKSTGW